MDSAAEFFNDAVVGEGLVDHQGRILRGRSAQVNESRGVGSDSVKCNLPIEYAADLTPVVAGKEAGASWNAHGMENALDF